MISPKHHTKLATKRSLRFFRMIPLCMLPLSTVGLSNQALADEVVIDQPGQHTEYVLELEPHVLLEPFYGPLPGAGFRGTIELIDNGFVPSINNTVGLGFGADVTQNSLWIPIVLQWNFFLSNRWSVFGEPGAAIIIYDNERDPTVIDYFSFYAGGRWHFSERATLTMRVGRPAFSLGISFLL
jgi:hypothetical protein